MGAKKKTIVGLSVFNCHVLSCWLSFSLFDGGECLDYFRGCGRLVRGLGVTYQGGVALSSLGDLSPKS